LKRAHAVHPICDLQIEYSLFSRGIEAEILPTARQLGIGITAYGVLSRGLLGGYWQKERTLANNDFRQHSPRFSGENITQNLLLTEALAKVAEEKGVSTAQLAIAWVLSQGADIIPLIGARRRERLKESLAALEVVLTAEDLLKIETAIPKGAAAGERYHHQQMAMLDSER
jgi:aryl-alcohol dehydrogenase-like predicted oxidoreductase